MREIKFRLRGLQSKKILGYESIFDNMWAESGNGIDFQPSEKNNECIREQYTGLKDKNGKEIYEGDLLKREGKSWAGKNTGELVVIEWEEKYAHFRARKIDGYGDQELNRGDSWSMSVMPDWFEICGNMYENPELLKL